jgi:hypothetical protein
MGHIEELALPPCWGSLKNWDNKIWSRVQRDCADEYQQQQYITDPSSHQRGRYKITNPQLSKENFKEKEKLVVGPRWLSVATKAY